MSSPIKKIESLIDFLPEKDAKLAKKFLDTKNFEGLRDLTTAVSVQLERSILRGNIPDKYKDLDITKIEELAAECIVYYSTICPEEEVLPDGF